MTAHDGNSKVNALSLQCPESLAKAHQRGRGEPQRSVSLRTSSRLRVWRLYVWLEGGGEVVLLPKAKKQRTRTHRKRNTHTTAERRQREGANASGWTTTGKHTKQQV